MTPEIEDYWQRALQALRTAESLVESDPAEIAVDKARLVVTAARTAAPEPLAES